MAKIAPGFYFLNVEDTALLQYILKALIGRDKQLIDDLLEEKRQWRNNIESILNKQLHHNAQIEEALEELIEDQRTLKKTFLDEATIKRILVDVVIDIYRKLFDKEPDFFDDDKNNLDSNRNPGAS